MVFRLGTWASGPTHMCPGLPQGSPLSDALFNIYADDDELHKIHLAGLGLTWSFVYDVLRYRIGSNKQDIVTDIKQTLHKETFWWKERTNFI